MADERVDSEIVSQFLLNTCRLRPRLTQHGALAALCCARAATLHPHHYHVESNLIPLITGSVAEFYIEPILRCVGDVDLMYHWDTLLAIPRGHPPPTQLPAKFNDYVEVFQIIDKSLTGLCVLTVTLLTGILS